MFKFKGKKQFIRLPLNYIRNFIAHKYSHAFNMEKCIAFNKYFLYKETLTSCNFAIRPQTLCTKTCHGNLVFLFILVP